MFYQSSKTAKAAIIGTIMPWTGPLGDIPKGWIICDGSILDADLYPLLVQAIGDTYNAGVSNLGGSFPDYTGQFVLPDLNGRHLMDIEDEYFDLQANGGTGKPVDTDVDARTLISPYIGDNVDNGVPTLFAGGSSLKTDVEFTLNERTGYSGRINGNTIIDGQGSQIVYVGGRKLGTSHVRAHSHTGAYETIRGAGTNERKPGLGVIPYENVTTRWTFVSTDNTGPDAEIINGTPFVEDTGLGFKYQYELVTDDWSAGLENKNGFGNGLPGRTLASVRSERPPTNIRPQYTTWTPIQNIANYNQAQLESQDTVQFGLFGNSLDVPTGFRNFYPDYPGDGNYGTLISNPGSDWTDEAIQAHVHDVIEITYDQGTLKPQASIASTAEVPAATVLDNASNIGALEIEMNTSQPSLTCQYIIRAY